MAGAACAAQAEREDDESIIRRHIRPALGSVRVGDITGSHVDAYMLARQALSPKTLHNHVTLLVSLLRFARDDLRWLGEVPRIRKPRITRRSADYNFLRTGEIERYLRAARDEGPLVHALYATAVYTGRRQGEIVALRWGDVDFDARLITVARSFDGPTKSGEVRHVPILDALLPVLRAWRLRHPGLLVFTNRDGRMFGKSGRIFQEVHARVLRRAGLTDAPRYGRRLPYTVFHDLRHTFASHWATRGGDIFKLQRILGHASIDQTLRYAHLAPAAFAEDFARFGAPLVVDAAPVVPMRRS